MKDFRAKCAVLPDDHLDVHEFVLGSQLFVGAHGPGDPRSRAGAATSVILSRRDARRLRDTLSRWLDKKPAKKAVKR